MNSVYRVRGKTCSCSGKDIDVRLRAATKDDIVGTFAKSMGFQAGQAIFECPVCGAKTVHWLFIRQGVKRAVSALFGRYCCELVDEDNDKWWCEHED